jgi:PRTRC genetic system protein B
MERDGGITIPGGTLTAQEALLVYRLEYNQLAPYADQGDFPRHYVTINPVTNGEIGAGRPLTREILSSFMGILSKDYNKPAFLPANVLAYVPDVQLTWWTPSSVRHLFFAKETGIPSGKGAVPGSVFSVTSGGLSIWALKKDERPDLRTDIYHYPLFNVYERGNCCLGNIEAPKRISVDDRGTWERIYFNGTCTNHLPPSLNGTTAKDLWTDIIRRKKRKFPLERLVQAGKLGDKLNAEGA